MRLTYSVSDEIDKQVHESDEKAIPEATGCEKIG
jgi:hypothetical protein